MISHVIYAMLRRIVHLRVLHILLLLPQRHVRPRQLECQIMPCPHIATFGAQSISVICVHCTVIERLLSMCNSHTQIKDVQRYGIGPVSGQSPVQVWNNAERILLFVQWHRLPGILPDAGHSRLEELPFLCQTHLQVRISSCCVHDC